MSTHIEWIAGSGKGQVWGWIEMHQPYLPSFAGELPYNVVLVKLDEGAFMYSNLVGVRFDDIRAGMRVEIVFQRATKDIALPKFKPVP